jgi:hypothetical protein
MSIIIKLLALVELRRILFSYLAPINLISLRNSSHQCKLLVSEADIDVLFSMSMAEGLVHWQLKLHNLKSLMESGNLFLSGSFLMHTLIRYFKNVGDIDLWSLTPDLKYSKTELFLCGYKFMEREEDENETFYPYRFQVDLFIRTFLLDDDIRTSPGYLMVRRNLSSVSPSIQVITMSSREGPQDMVDGFDIDVVKFFISSDFKCPISDINTICNYRKFYHLIKMQFYISRPHNDHYYQRQFGVRINKYYAKGLTLCKCVRKNYM